MSYSLIRKRKTLIRRIKVDKVKMAFVLFFFFIILSCQRVSHSPKAPRTRPNTLSYALAINPITFDPAVAQDNDTLDLMQQIYENLVTLSEDATIRPKLARKWTLSADGKIYTFYLKRGVKFHNGREMTAEDVKWTFERSCNPKLASPTVENYLNDICGVVEKIKGQASSVSGVQIIDPYTIKIQLKKRCPYFLGKLTYPVSAILPRGGVPFEHPVDDPAQVIGTGPFYLSEYLPYQQVSLKSFLNYHEGAPKIDGIERPIIQDPFTRLNKYQSGELDFVTIDRRNLPRLLNHPQYNHQLRFYKRPSLFYLGLNQSAFEPFQDVRVRKAMLLAIDRRALLQNILGGMYEQANSILPWGVPGHYRHAALEDFNPKKARILLKEAGYSLERPFPVLELFVRSEHPEATLVGEFVVTQLRKHLGIPAQLRRLGTQLFLEKRNRNEMSFSANVWMADYLDPHNFLSFMLGTNGPENRTGYSNSDFDILCEKADNAPSSGERLSYYLKAEEIALQDVPWIPIYFVKDAELVHPRVSGLKWSPFGYLSHSKVELDKK